MPSNWFNAFIAISIAIGVILILIVGMRRRRRDLRQYLEPVLRQCGVEFVSVITPRMFHVGPFPRIEMELGRPVSNVVGIWGEYSEYKIVIFRDPSGKTGEIWALVEFEVFRFRRVRWRAEKKEGLPAEVLKILEN